MVKINSFDVVYTNGLGKLLLDVGINMAYAAFSELYRLRSI